MQAAAAHSSCSNSLPAHTALRRVASATASCCSTRVKDTGLQEEEEVCICIYNIYIYMQVGSVLQRAPQCLCSAATVPVCTCHTGGQSQSTEHLPLLAGVTLPPVTDDGRALLPLVSVVTCQPCLLLPPRQLGHMSTVPLSSGVTGMACGHSTPPLIRFCVIYCRRFAAVTTQKLRAPSCVGRRRSQTHVFARHHRTHATLLLHASARVALRCCRCCPAAVAALLPLPLAAETTCCSRSSSRVAA